MPESIDCSATGKNGAIYQDPQSVNCTCPNDVPQIPQTRLAELPEEVDCGFDYGKAMRQDREERARQAAEASQVAAEAAAGGQGVGSTTTSNEAAA